MPDDRIPKVAPPRRADLGSVVVLLRHDLDLGTVARTRALLRTACAGHVAGRWVIVEFDSDRFVGVCGLDVLLECATDVQSRGGRFGVANPPGSLRRMHGLVRLGAVLVLFDRVHDVPDSVTVQAANHKLSAC